jgi:hypothetical protein
MKRVVIASIVLALTMLNPCTGIADWWTEAYNTGGEIDCPPQSGGSSDTWAEWTITTILCGDQFEYPFFLAGFAFPCSGPTGEWVLWVHDLPPDYPDSPLSAQLSGEFTPVITDPEVELPLEYSYVQISPPIEVYYWQYITFGYRNPGHCGLIPFNGVTTWGWIYDSWANDSAYGKTALLQIMDSYGSGTLARPENISWIKSLY